MVTVPEYRLRAHSGRRRSRVLLTLGRNEHQWFARLSDCASSTPHPGIHRVACNEKRMTSLATINKWEENLTESN